MGLRYNVDCFQNVFFIKVIAYKKEGDSENKTDPESNAINALH